MAPQTLPVADPHTWVDVVGGVQSIFTIAAIIVGGLWGYFKFFHGRTFKERLEVSVGASQAKSEGVAFLDVTIMVRNVGLSKVPLVDEGAGLRVLACVDWVAQSVETAALAEWEWVATESIMRDHDWIEPGETVTDNLVFKLPAQLIGPMRLELVVASKTLMWVASTVSPQEGEGHDGRTEAKRLTAALGAETEGQGASRRD